MEQTAISGDIALVIIVVGIIWILYTNKQTTNEN